MPVIWILIVGGILYWVLRILETKYASNNEKQTDKTIPAVAPAAPSTIPPCETPAAADVTPPSEADNSAAPLPDGALPFIDTIPGLPEETKAELRGLKLATREEICKTSDKNLLAVKGIGPARLKQIRGLCTAQ